MVFRCCLQGNLRQRCPPREYSWDFFNQVSEAANHPFFGGCASHLLETHRFDSSQKLPVSLIRVFSRGNPLFLSKLLFKFETYLLPVLHRQSELLEFLFLCESEGVREHGPGHPDIFELSFPWLDLTSCKLPTVYRLIKLYRVKLKKMRGAIEQLGQHLLNLLKHPGPYEAKTVVAYLSLASQSNFRLVIFGPLLDFLEDCPTTDQQLSYLVHFLMKYGIDHRLTGRSLARFEERLPRITHQVWLSQTLLGLGFRGHHHLVIQVIRQLQTSHSDWNPRLRHQLVILRHYMEAIGLKADFPVVELPENLEVSALPSLSSEQHCEVANALDDLGIPYRMEVGLGPYVVDLLLETSKIVLEIDGPMHFLESETGFDEYDMSSQIKSRILENWGYRVIHVHFQDWPSGRTHQSCWLANLLKSGN